MKDVDIVVGAQYGDEGKGMIAKLLADQHQYSWTARVGAMNAEHRFIHRGCEYCGRVLPSAAADRLGMTVYLGPGHCFNPGHLLREAVHMQVPLSKIWVDKHAMWLRPEHADANLIIGNERGTTGWGIGAALAEKVRRRPGTRLMGDCPEMIRTLEDHLTDVPGMLANHEDGLLEGSQGTWLSLNHGHYPYCTGKDVTAPALCAELGISHKRVRRVVGVVRMVPMRVPGNSGPAAGREISFDSVESRTGLRVPHHKRLQGDTSRWSASDEERLFEIDYQEIIRGDLLNGYTHLVVTFADYHRSGNYKATSWNQLHQDTKEVVERLSDIAPVVLIRTGQGEHDNIWLEDWA